ncbi:MAG: hypothetical protein PVI90_02870, partial [Desulfobacteraceae bacterium]
GKAPSDISAKITDRIIKSIGYKAPLALKMADKIIEAQKTLSIKAGIELELSLLKEIFQTADALEGLQSSLQRRRPIFHSA